MQNAFWTQKMHSTGHRLLDIVHKSMHDQSRSIAELVIDWRSVFDQRVRVVECDAMLRPPQCVHVLDAPRLH